MAPLSRYWTTIPRRSYGIFLTGVFVIFSTISLANDAANQGLQPVPRLVLSIVVTSGFSVLYAMAGILFREKFWKPFIPLFIVHFILMNVLLNLYPNYAWPNQLDSAGLTALHNRISFDRYFIIVCVFVGYACINYVSVRESRRYARLRSEIELATEIHHVLVPPIATTIAGFEFYGISVPSGEVGGDLVDLASSPSKPADWVAYLADVSGHGVAPGVIMAMVKSSARMLLSSAAGAGSDSGAGSSHLMARLNEVLYPLKKPDMFITFCYVAREAGVTHIGLAGHPPILHFSAKANTIHTRDGPNMPLGILPEGDFPSSTIESQPGDIFALYTDGFVEAANPAGEEFGLQRLQSELQKHAREPLATIATALRSAVNAHGPQFDDQSLLLIRHL
jgi:sigma-B regulation protein RsbU (phosphoserine phosphatase)